MVPAPEPEPIRPGLKLLAAGLLLGCIVGLWAFFGHSAGDPLITEEHALAAYDPPGRSNAHHGRRGSRRSVSPRDGGVGVVESPDVRLRREDPQMFASRRSEGPPDAGVRHPFAPMLRTGHISTTGGDAPVAVGATCDVRVLPVRARAFNCLVRVMCDGVVLYPNQTETAGYAPCDLESGLPVRAEDSGQTHSDGDPTLDVDLPARRVVVTDSGPGVPSFEATVRLDPLPRFI